jgi:hypothetical protein
MSAEHNWLPNESERQADVITFMDKNLSMSTAYKYRIRRRNAWAWSDYSYFEHQNTGVVSSSLKSVLLTPAFVIKEDIKANPTTTFIESGP